MYFPVNEGLATGIKKRAIFKGPSDASHRRLLSADPPPPAVPAVVRSRAVRRDCLGISENKQPSRRSGQ